MSSVRRNGALNMPMSCNGGCHILNRAYKVSALTRVKSALRKAHPSNSIDSKGYVLHNWDNLIEGVCPTDFEGDLSGGKGSELAWKFRAIDSSSALAVNAFAPFRRRIKDLLFPTAEEFEVLSFERRCPTGLVGSQPNLDILLESPNRVMGIESKLKEYLEFDPKKFPFTPQYIEKIRDKRRNSAWFELMIKLIDEPLLYRHVNAAQLVKHAFGLAHTFQHIPATLVYLYWEPKNPDGELDFEEHRREIDVLLSYVAGHEPRLLAVSYATLWDLWETGPNWLVRHVANTFVCKCGRSPLQK